MSCSAGYTSWSDTCVDGIRACDARCAGHSPNGDWGRVESYSSWSGLVPSAGFEPAPLGLGKFAKPSTPGITRHLSLHTGFLQRPLTSLVIAVSFPKSFP